MISSAERLAAPFTHIQGFLHGFVTGGGTTGATLDTLVAVVPAQIRLVWASAQAAGSSPTIVDVTINGTSVWHNPVDRPSLPGGTVGKFTSGRINRSAVQPGDVLRLVVAQAGGGGSAIAATVALEDPSERSG